MSKLTKLISKIINLLEHEIVSLVGKKNTNMSKKKEVVLVINKLVLILHQLNKLDKELIVDEPALNKEEQEIINSYLAKYYSSSSE